MYKVFIDNHPVIIATNYENKDPRRIYHHNYGGRGTFHTIIKDFNEKKYEAARIYHPDEDFVWMEFESMYHLMYAAGGLVTNGEGKKLFIEWLGLWDLPKGKIEEGESVEEGAIREVEEETGIANISLGPLIHETWHTYEHKGKKILKKTSWFEMKVEGSPALIPQTEEDITKAEWLTDDEIKEKVVGNTYGSILDVLNA